MSKFHKNRKAPILILTHTRINHLEKCINSLLKCGESKETELFISSDFYRNENEMDKVFKIRQYIESIKGFKKVTPILFNKNVGSTRAFYFCKDMVFKKHDKIIILEDDIEVSPLFLNFINEGLEFYKDDPNIFSICGFSASIMSDFYDINTPNKIYFNHSWAAWGVASWKDKFLEFIDFRNSNGLLNIINEDLKNNQLVKSLNILSPKYYIHLLYCIKNKKVPVFDYSAAYYCLKNSMYNVYSHHTLTKNYGHDGTGLRSRKNELINSKMDRAKYPSTRLHHGEVLTLLKPRIQWL